ncbi:hypothetical protein KY284_021551 [Solanum tuberosum]|nr:hypothetical protein KY284_021551 [Solanum tuberosum]
MDNMRVGEQELKQSNKENQKTEPPQSGGGAAVSPPSASSSPAHEFSFTISLHPTNSTKALESKTKQNLNPNLNPNPNQNPSAIDLTPADEIFFHGHLLPLHLLSHLPVSPRSSTNSIDSSIPIRKNTSNSNNNSSKGIKRGAYSAPVSMKNSPTNSGLLVATPGGNYGNSSSSSSSDSTMEELQSAIQAAIAHCKKSSSSMEDKKIKISSS